MEILTTIMDYVEEAFGSIVLAQGKRSLCVFFICIGLTAFSKILDLCGYYTFISLPEGIIASMFSVIMVLLGYRNMKMIGKIKLRFKVGGKK